MDKPAPTPSTAMAAPEPAKPPPPAPKILMGLNAEEVAKLIGQPAFRRADNPAAIWRYHEGGCVLDLYLRTDGPATRVVFFEFRPQDGTGAVDAAGCMARLAARRAASEAR